MKSKTSFFLENTLVYRWLIIIALPFYYFTDQFITQRDVIFAINLSILVLSALSFRKIWIQVISSGLISYISNFTVSEWNPHMFLFHWFSSFVVSALIMTLIEKYLNEKRNTIDLINSLAKSLDSRDEYTALHSHNVATYSRKIAKEMNLSNSACDNIYFGGLLHDIGKIGVSEHTLNKPAKLTEQEYNQIKQHPLIGFNLVKHINRFESSGILNMILHHHERYDGKGYPHGLKGNNIPLEARIMAVADSFDAMTSKRVYRRQADWEEVLKELTKNKETQFDPIVVNAFVTVLKAEKFQTTYNKDQNHREKDILTHNQAII
ncbi:HD-GYP domain-containing protein [Paraliobacillus sp. X-1268]|uniref:HD-GYP domain-containing protein n=1 Tax=Paraliobacillus sp. X-1268 TaxID=2213193 RepID=UPI000E3CE8C2|nr:HD-GYP domain-containing protein [Paraliobacillus sp. X-1268]